MNLLFTFKIEKDEELVDFNDFQNKLQLLLNESQLFQVILDKEDNPKDFEHFVEVALRNETARIMSQKTLMEVFFICLEQIQKVDQLRGLLPLLFSKYICIASNEIE